MTSPGRASLDEVHSESVYRAPPALGRASGKQAEEGEKLQTMVKAAEEGRRRGAGEGHS